MKIDREFVTATPPTEPMSNLPPLQEMPPSRRLKWWLRPIFWIAVIVAVLVFFIWRANHQVDANARPAGARGGGGGGGGGGRFGFGNAPLPVVVRAAVKGDINIYLNGLGTVTPLATVTLRTQITGQLMKVSFVEGQMVKQGDVLAEIDPRPYEVALQQAQGQLQQALAQLKEAQIDLARYKTLSEQDSIARQTVDSQAALVTQDEGLVQTSQAAIASATLNLTYCHITAPVAGRVGLRPGGPGQLCDAGRSQRAGRPDPGEADHGDLFAPGRQRARRRRPRACRGRKSRSTPMTGR